MIKYKFPEFNLEIVDPTVTVSTDLKGVDSINNTVTVDVLLTTPDGSSFGICLSGIPSDGLNLNIDEAILLANTKTRLQDFEV